MMKFLLPLLLAFSLYTSAQHQAHLDIGNVKALVNSNGLLFHDTATNRAGFEVPKGLGVHSIFNSGFIISSKNTNNGLSELGISSNVNTHESDFSVGPIHLIDQQPDTDDKFQRLWKIEKADVDSHISNWNSTNYTIPSSIKDWPGNGNRNTSKVLAPFVDIDNDSIYEPEDGEYPRIKGDQAIFLITNNFNIPENPNIRVIPVYDSTGNVIGLDSVPVFEKSGQSALELHLLLYSYSGSTEEIGNTVFVNAKLHNRSDNQIGDINELRLSVFSDFDLGNGSDDYLGTDTVRNMFYSYNADSLDDGFGNISNYGINLAAQGVKFLSKNLSSSMQRVQNTVGQSELPIHLRNYQYNFWQNGRSLFYGGNGFDFMNGCADSSKRVNFIFSGDPTLINTPSEWTELNPCNGDTSIVNIPGDRQMMGSPDLPDQLNHGQFVEFDYAYVFARDTGIIASVVALQVAADSVQAFYDRNRFVGINKTSINSELDFIMYPNPTKETVTIEANLSNFEIEIIDIQGRVTGRYQNTKIIDISNFSQGIYFVKVGNEKNVGLKKLIIAK